MNVQHAGCSITKSTRKNKDIFHAGMSAEKKGIKKHTHKHKQARQCITHNHAYCLNIYNNQQTGKQP